MVTMENADEVMQILERFTRLKQKEIPKELDDYLQYVAKTGDTVFKWASLKYLFREKLLNVIKNFYDTSPRTDEIPQYPNVDPFNYESMKSSLLERLELFNAAPFTIQRLCELLIDPRKQYSRIDKFMRALEKNILVSTIEPGRKRTESENGDSLDSMVNGDLSLDVNVDIDMENESIFLEGQNGSATAEETAESSSEATVKDKPVTASPKAAHRTDDDNLPNPKKAKLDLPESKQEQTEVEQKSSENVQQTSSEKVETSDPVADVSNANEAPSAEEKHKENGTNGSEEEKSAEIVDEAKPDKADEIATNVNDMEVDAEPVPKEINQESESEKQTLEENPVDAEVKTDVKEVEKIVEPENAEEKGTLEPKEKIETDDKVQQKSDDSETDVNLEKKTEDKKEKCDEVDNKLEDESKKEEINEKIVEKQESEKCEKDEKVPEERISAVNNSSETVKQTAEDESAKETEELVSKESNDDKKDDVDEKDNVINKDAVVTDATDNVATVVTATAAEEEKISTLESDKNQSKNESESETSEKPSESTATTTTTESTESVAPKEAADSDAPSETTVNTDEIISSTTKDASDEPITVVTKPEETAGSSNEVESGNSVTAEEKKETAVVDLKESEAVAETSISTTKSEKLVADTVSESESTCETAKVVEELVTVEASVPVVDTSVISSAQEELPQPAEVVAEVATEVNEAATVAVVAAEVEAAAPAAVVAPAAAITEVKPVEDAVPVVSLTTPSEIEAATISTTTPSIVESVVPPIALVPPQLALNDQPMEDVATIDSTIVEEVIMAESTCAEMATDSMDAAKDEPSGMEVDDTSQEAMDQ